LKINAHPTARRQCGRCVNRFNCYYNTAGCFGVNPLGGGGSGAYANWLAAPDDIGDSDHYRFTYLDTEAIESNEDELDDESFEMNSYEEFWEPLSFDWEDTSLILLAGQAVIIEAEFAREDAVSDLEDDDFEEDGDHEGFTTFLGPNEAQAFGIGDNVVAFAGGYGIDDPVDIVEAVIDAQTGNGERYGEASENMSTLLGELGGSVATGSTMEEVDADNPENGQFENMVAEGDTATINGETADRKWVIVYEEQDDVDTGDLEDWVDENDSNGAVFDDVDDISYNQNGRKGVVTGTIDTDDL